MIRGGVGRGNRIKCSENERSIVYRDDMLSYLIKKVVDCRQKSREFIRLELAIQACLDTRQNKQGRGIITGF